MRKKEAHTHYTSPLAYDLENSVAKEYKTAYAKNHFLEGFGNFLFAVRVPSENLKDSHEDRGATDVYDEQLLELYALSLAKAEIEASEATADTAGTVLDNILNETDDLFLGELQKREKWQKYLTLECITGWYDDKRRAAARGLAKKGITLQEKVDEVDVPAVPKPRKLWPLYKLVAANTVLLAGLAVGAVVGALYGDSKFRKFEKRADSIEYNVNSSISRIEKSMKPENIINQAETYLKSSEGQKKLQGFYDDFEIWWKQEGLAQDEFITFWNNIIQPGMNSQGQLSAQYICDELEKKYKFKKTAERLNKIAEMLDGE